MPIIRSGRSSNHKYPEHPNVIEVRSTLSNKWGGAMNADDGTHLAELVLENPAAVVDFSRVQGMSYDFHKALFRRLARDWGFDRIRSRLHFAGLGSSEGYFWRALAMAIEEDVHRHPDWRQGLCWSCAAELPKGGRKYCSMD